MKKALFIFLLFSSLSPAIGQSFSIKSVLSYPFPTQLVASPTDGKIAWACNEQGKRNIYVAEAPDYSAKKVTSFSDDDGQELTSLSISADGKWVVFVRGGDHGGRDGGPVNANSSPVAPKMQVFAQPYIGGEMIALGEGDQPVISPDSKTVIFATSGQIKSVPIDGSSTAKNLFYAKGINSAYKYSPDGKKIAFVCNRTDHSYIGIYSDQVTPIQWLMPAFSKDSAPVWSPDNEEIAFVRMQGSGGEADSILAKKHQPWAILTVNVASGMGKQIWKAPETLRGSYPSIEGGANLAWANGKIIFTSYEDGWPHLYAMDSDGSKRMLLTPGNFAVENIKLSNDKKTLIFAANAGKDLADVDRRHIYKVAVDNGNMQALTSGNGIEAFPVMANNDNDLFCLSATAQRPLLPAKIASKTIKLIGETLMPKEFPMEQLVAPKHVRFKAADGQQVYGQLFEPLKKTKNSPAIVYVHGGPQRQMYLGWSTMDYYSIDYALNQYLVSMGFTVLSVNYRLGLGYGYDFHKPLKAGAQGASEYLDVKAAGEWLASQPNIDRNRIGIYGGSYGGYLTALALGRNSKLFAAGVDIHGVNNRFSSVPDAKAPDAELAAHIAETSSPIYYLKTWTSPTLLIHADDDRNVAFNQTVDLAKRFEDKKFDFEFLAIPDDTHHWMKFSNAVKVSEATADFLKRKLMKN
ncbi:S9 family peptidase [Pedobacter sandarakinus]|uniref:S9 family peptidase n=1 Tax=Pedobacter sandarakinus TaxID=353156 RepID=UPI0022463FB8|nr:prolyl oligopeptidase family serine peptidase [Pedobacter sandarakinus]MCX2573030.1 prolyl oligopeptidase family serine peptidase [Pedobacter sandarakinus]